MKLKMHLSCFKTIVQNQGCICWGLSFYKAYTSTMYLRKTKVLHKYEEKRSRAMKIYNCTHRTEELDNATCSSISYTLASVTHFDVHNPGLNTLTNKHSSGVTSSGFKVPRGHLTTWRITKVEIWKEGTALLGRGDWGNTFSKVLIS